MDKELSHFNIAGRARMVDVTDKNETDRVAEAGGRIVMAAETLARIEAGTIGKGDVLAVAQVAGIMAAKKTWELIPMCHPLLLSGIDISFVIDRTASAVEIRAIVKTTGRTGVEMEALSAVSGAALTIYDMCKAIDRGMCVESIRLLRKSGGRSGIYEREGD
ncbi:MAG: molybdenum cofactor biosynthesis protein [Firmicutes bacterium]|nr:molybdenum cofactor biosynthesis protein [Bacillota bacterium]